MTAELQNVLFDVARFGSCAVDDDLIQKMQAITGGPVHHFIRRRIFWSHRYAPDVLSVFRRAKECFVLCSQRIGCYLGCLRKSGTFLFVYWPWSIIGVDAHRSLSTFHYDQVIDSMRGTR